ncbi:unnamed protein product [Lymnaea stagnalis]|uniref:EGF-like domain-containing protein n=1 Tax=Lymnaea stagnalis TaxID=6523 RepID=A0AAV2HRI4_LYMST
MAWSTLVGSLLICLVVRAEEYQGRHVCNQQMDAMKPVPIRQSYLRAVYNPDLNKMTYQTAYRTIIRMQLNNQPMTGCCPGWEKRSPQDLGCNKAVCRESCENGGYCVAPDICSCAEGYSGYRCQIDIDECRGVNKCHQSCVNVPGSYTCECVEGFKLGTDGHSCELCLSCTKEFQDIMYQMDSVSKVKDEMLDLELQANKVVELEKQAKSFQEVTIKMNGLDDIKSQVTDLQGLKDEIVQLKKAQESDSETITILKAQLFELQHVKGDLETLKDLKAQLKDLQEMKSQIESLREFKSGTESLLQKKAGVESVEELRKEVTNITQLVSDQDDVIQGMKVRVGNVERDSSEKLSLLNGTVEKLRGAASSAVNVTSQLKAQTKHLQALSARVDGVDEMREQLAKMVGDLQRLQEEKAAIMANLTSIARHRDNSEAFHGLDSTTPEPVTSTAPYDTDETEQQNILGRLASMSEQISILEEKISQCKCGEQDYGRRRPRG